MMRLACGGGVPVGRPAHATGGAHGWCSRVGRRHACARQRDALHAQLPAGPSGYHLDAAVANCVCASATVCVCRRRVCRVFREPMAARTDADRRKRGRVPAIGDWADGVHRGVARASSPKRRPKTRTGAGGGAVVGLAQGWKSANAQIYYYYYWACGCARQIRRSGTDTPSTSLHHDSAHIVIERTSASRLTGRCS